MAGVLAPVTPGLPPGASHAGDSDSLGWRRVGALNVADVLGL